MHAIATEPNRIVSTQNTVLESTVAKMNIGIVAAMKNTATIQINAVERPRRHPVRSGPAASGCGAALVMGEKVSVVQVVSAHFVR